MSMKKIVAVACATALAGCTTAPEKISGSYVSPIQYSNYDCDQIRLEMQRVSAKVSEVAGVQKRQANNDAVAMGVGLVIFWPALFFLAGGNDRKEELANLKGTYDALTTTAIEKKCPYADELVRAQEQQAQQGKKKRS